MLAEVQDDRIVFADASYHDGQRLKPLPGARWSPMTREWSMPLSWAACQQLRGEFGAQLVIGDGLSAWAWAEKTERIDPSMALRGLEMPEGARYLEALERVEAWYDDKKLLSHQRPGSLLLAVAKRVLEANPMGSGKTIMAITGLNVLRGTGANVFPALVICPNTMKRVWRDELAIWASDLRVQVVGGSATKRVEQINAGADITIINWDLLRHHSRLAPYGSIALRGCVVCDPQGGANTRRQGLCEKCERDLNLVPYRTVIVDEAHLAKDPKATRTRAAWAIAHGKAVEYCWALTGTPIANHPGDLWSIMHLVAPQEHQTKSKWLDRYALLSWNIFGGMDIVGLRPEHRDEFFRIFDPRFRRLPKELILPDLPPKTYTPRYVQMSAKQAKAYKQMKERMVTELDDDDIMIATSPMTQHTRLSQFASSYAEIDSETGKAVLSEPSGKLDEMMTILDELGDEPLVVTAVSRQLIMMASKRLTDAGITHSVIRGGQSEDERANARTQFQDGAVRVCLVVMAAGGVGITLTRAGYILFLQRSWSMVDNKQMEERVHRHGSEIHDKIIVIDLITEDTIEEKQLIDIEIKVERMEEIVRDRQSLRELII